METISINTPSMKGNIRIGEDVLPARLPLLTAGQKNFVVIDENVYKLYPAFVEKYFSSAEIYVFPAGEEHKNFQSLYGILSKMTEAGLHRTSKLFAVGGGVVGDIAGLAAALYMRGIACVQIPTTLLSQIDSSVGGKTAVDLGGVKNVVGAFFQPQEVLIDPTFLRTLPPRELKCGLGEMLKYGVLNKDILRVLQENVDEFADLNFLKALISVCVQHKKQVVEADEKESGERKSLNVGHTTGHAIELAHGLSHGESVLYGMWLETYMAIEADVCEREYGEQILRLIEKGLQVHPIAKLDFSHIQEDGKKALVDKKNTQSGVIQMAVAKSEGEWTTFSLPFSEYQAGLLRASQAFLRRS